MRETVGACKSTHHRQTTYIDWTAIGFALCTLLVPVAWISTMVALIVTGLG